MRRTLPPWLYCCSLTLLVTAFGCAQSDPANNGTGGSSGGSSSSTGGSGSGTGGSNGTGGITTGTGGSTGGNTGTGGIVTGTGGHTGGSGGHAGSPGSGGRAGSPGTGGSSTGSGGTGSGSTCVTIMSSAVSTKISTVGIVTFSSTISKPTEGHIDFGLDTSYGMQAPVDFTQTNNKTLLLGMKASKTYHYNVSVTDGSTTCTSGDQTIMTGALPNGGLPTLTITTNDKTKLYGGFLVTGSYSGSKYQSFIIDGDGDYVWFYNDGSDGCGTRMSYDGQYMWIANGNVPATSGSTHVHRVTMDGMVDDDFSTAVANESHQILPLPDGSLAFYALPQGQKCDDIKILPPNATPTSTAKTLVNAGTAHGGSGNCHLNNIEYDPSDDSLVFSDLDNSCLTKVSRQTGSTIWVWSGTNVNSTITGDLWTGGEHGFHIVSPTDYVIFNNNTPNNSVALELTLDATAKKSTKKWSYTSNPGIKVMVLGDVQRMTSNGPTGAGMGNTIVDYGTGNQIHEVDANGTLLQQIKSQYPFGFIEKRFSLYGKPTR
jgi:hypothetical protein